jgi:hypothetical protein
METFRDLEKRYNGSHVHAKDVDTSSGKITLDRRKSVISLSNLAPVKYREDQNGWFDLRLNGIDGTEILLKNALEIGNYFYGKPHSRVGVDIFPNVVVFNADKLTKSNQVNSISFRLKNFEYFFWYKFIESHFLYKTSPSELSAIRKLQNKRYDFRRPDNIYIVRARQKILQFKIKDKSYEISAGLSTRRSGATRLVIKTLITARINFTKPCNISDAINFVWAWKRFFAQVAMDPLPLEGISCRALRTRYPEAAIYLPNAARNKARGSRVPFHPGDPPFNQWKDRSKLAAVMRSWLLKSDERRQFRSLVDRVVENMNERTALEDLVTLCAAIEGLSELDQGGIISDENIDTLVDGAGRAAATANIQVPVDRIRGLLTMLQHQGLPNRLKLLMGRLDKLFSTDDQKLVASKVLSLRNIAAHGRSISDSVVPKVRPAIEALASICVAYDLISSGLPSETHDRPINAVRRTRDAIAALR